MFIFPANLPVIRWSDCCHGNTSVGGTQCFKYFRAWVPPSKALPQEKKGEGAVVSKLFLVIHGKHYIIAQM